MIIRKPAIAGTLESSDVQVMIEPGTGRLSLAIESSVIHQFGSQIRAIVMETLERLDVSDASITVKDRGALDCTIKARVECAVFRSNDQDRQIPWGGAVQ